MSRRQPAGAGDPPAVLFPVTGITGLQQLGARPFVQNPFYGAALIVDVVLSFAVRSRRRKAA
ncbi:hypothetical protein [Pseudonocardia sp.]|uniref:hypothetical protein n=1 Tax=Pseudonocardia sp. TaxID=60912 RepID=UPI003D0CB27E